jgi:hypothetical protein
MNWASIFTGNTAFRASRRIGEFSNYMTVEETADDELEISEHPVQRGAEITDNAYKKMPVLNVSISFGADLLVPLDETYRSMVKLQESRIPFQVITGKRVYNDMLIKSLRQTTDKNTDAVLALSLVLKQIKIVDFTTTTVPPRSRQAEPGRTGATERAGSKKAQKVKDQDQPTKQSALKKAAGIFQ